MASPLQAAIDRMLKDQSEQTTMIEALWRLFAASTQIPAGGVQWIESRRCFFAGAATLFEAVMRVMDEDRDPTEADLGRMQRIADELQRAQQEIFEGRA